MASDQWERFQPIIDTLEDAVRKHLERESGPLEVTADDIAEFVHLTDQEQLYNRLSEHSDLREAAQLISPEAESVIADSRSALALWGLYVRTNQKATDNPMFDNSVSSAQLEELLNFINHFVDGSSSPSLKPNNVQVVVGRPPRYFEARQKSIKWLKNSDTDTFSALWPIALETYEEPCERLIQRSNKTSFVFDQKVADAVQSDEREWLASMQQQNQFYTRTSPKEFNFFLFLLDECVIIGVYQHFSPNSTGVVLKTSDTAFHTWASEVFDNYWNRSEQVSWTQDKLQ